MTGVQTCALPIYGSPEIGILRSMVLYSGRSEERRVGKSVQSRVDLGGRRIIKKKKKKKCIKCIKIKIAEKIE